MFRMKLLCGSLISLLLLANTAPVRAEAADKQAAATAVQTVYEDYGDEYSDEDGDASETDIAGSTYGKIEQKILQSDQGISVSLDYGIDGFAAWMFAA